MTRTSMSSVAAASLQVPAVLRVLLVEDDEADAFLVRELLDEVRAPIHLTVVTTVEEAEQVLLGEGVDCVLLDLGLPDAAGLSALRRLRELGDHLSICVLTNFGDDLAGVAAVAEGAKDYLIKGQVDGALLARSIRYAVERRRAEENVRRLRLAELQRRESARLERGLLPHPLLHRDDLAVHPYYQPGGTTELGGDFYDVIQSGPERLSMMVGDVCGNGPDAAALGVELRVAWRALTLATVDEDAVLPAMERVLRSERRGEDIFATIAMVTVSLATKTVTVRLAGHPPPLLLAGGVVTTLPSQPGAVLGVFDDAQWPAVTSELGDDWALLLYTDGLIEGRLDGGARPDLRDTGGGNLDAGGANNGPTEGRLGVKGLCHLVAAATTAGVPQDRLPGWLHDQARQRHGRDLEDDVAMLLLTAAAAGAVRPDAAA